MITIDLHPEPLTRQEFAPFGDVIDCDGAASFPINEGTTDRFHDLAELDVVQSGGRPIVSIFRGRPRAYPLEITMMERHPISSQAFYPLENRPYIVVVAAADKKPLKSDLRVFLATGSQGVNYHRGVWHHPLLVLQSESDFLIVDRGGEGHNLDEVTLNDDTRATIIL